MKFVTWIRSVQQITFRSMQLTLLVLWSWKSIHDLVDCFIAGKTCQLSSFFQIWIKLGLTVYYIPQKKKYWLNLMHCFMKSQNNFAHTSICILRCCLKLASKVMKIVNDSSNTSGTELTPFLDNATHRYCLIALMNMAFVRNTGPALWRMDRSSCKERILERSSCDLKYKKHDLSNAVSQRNKQHLFGIFFFSF